MAFIAVAIGGGALAGLAGSVIGAHAAGDAAQAQTDAANHASQLQYDQYQQQRTDQEPWRQAGVTALSGLANPDFQKTFSQSDFQKDPGYDFRMQQGQQAIERSAAANGGLQSGGTLKALTQYGQNFASNEYQNAYNRFNNDQTNRFNRLSSIAGLGQTANTQNAASGQNYANQVGANINGAAQAQGAAGIAGANAWSSGLSGLSNLGVQGSWMSQWNKTHPQNEDTLSGAVGM
jgi:hypothetical protein